MLPTLESKFVIRERENSTFLFCLRLFKCLFISLALFLFTAITTAAQSNVTTQHNDIARTGANPNETILTPTNVNTNTFGKLFSYLVDGSVYAQPLYMPGVTMGAGTTQAGTSHNVVFVATEHDSVFAFDADNNSGANANPLWQVSLLGTGETTVSSADVETTNITPEIGITSTPVIDPATNTIYVLAKSTVADTTFIQRLHALDITTGQEKFGGPMALSASVPGTGNGSSGRTLNWDPLWENNRTSLLLLNGIVYIGFGSHGDNGPWHGWILAYNASTLTQTGAWCTTPNAAGAGIWIGGTGLAADVPSGKPYGRIFTPTGNGTFDATAPNYTNAMDYGDSIVKLDLNNGVPTMNANGTVVGDDFTPHDQAAMDSGDEDVASGGVVLIPPDSAVQVGKSGRVYILNREDLGGYNPNNTTDPGQAASVGGLWGAPAYWNGNVYIWGTNDNLKAFSYANGVLSSSPTSTSNESAGFFSPSPAVSANGTTNGIVWSMLTDNYGSNGTAILYAHDASNVANLLYSSATNATRDNPGNSVKFTVPTVVNGKVYVGSESQLSVFGLLSGTTQVATPVITPASESFSPSVQVTITDSASGASIYYTTDGSLPTTGSTQYSGPFTLTTTSTVNAFAIGTGLSQSAVASATYSLTTQAAMPTFNPAPGSYTAVQTVTISTTTPSATIYYTTNGTTPTTSSTQYTGPISVAVTETLSAIAVASGLSNSPVASGLYTFDLGVSSISFASGFASGGMNLLGSAKLNGSSLELTDGGTDEAAAAWYQVEANIESFATDFTFQITPGTNPTADGFTFAIQANNSTAVGPAGGDLGYGGGTGRIPNSVAVKFDLYNNDGEGTDSTGLYTNGAAPTMPAVNMTGSGVNLHSGDPFHVHITYNGTTLVMTITDTTTNATFSTSWTVGIPTIVGDVVAYVGFTAGTGGDTAVQNIQAWTFGPLGATATPTFNPAGGTYTTAQTITISDATSGATIYYTTNGTTPTTSSTQYTGPLTVSATEMIEAIAVASGDATSAVGTAAYTITTSAMTATPTFSPAGGTYTTTQTVTISDATSGATIYYTTNGTTPTISSTQYTGPLTVGATETIEAIAVASGDATSGVGTAAYTITSGGTPVINLGTGFTAGAMTLNGNATLNGTRLRLTDGGTDEASSAWYSSTVNIQQFTTNFSFQITGGTNPTADGFAFVIQGGSSSALGPDGGGLGYGPATPGGTAGIGKSVAVKFDLYSNDGEGVDSTGLYTDGASPTMPAVNMTSSGLNLHTTDVFNVQISYNGTNLTMTITDVTTNATFTQAWPINIPTTVGGNTALVGFTGGSGGDTAIQEIIGWTMSSTTGVAATPTFSPAGGTYTTAQTVTISDATSGATIYYTTNGTTPTTSSTQYTGPLTVGAGQAPTFVSGAVKSQNNGSLVLTLNVGNPVAGNLIGAAVTWGSPGPAGSPAMTVTDNCASGGSSDTYILLNSILVGGGSNIAQYWTTVGATTSNCTITFTSGSSSNDGFLSAAAGIVSGANTVEQSTLKIQDNPGTGTNAITSGGTAATSHADLVMGWTMNPEYNGEAAPSAGTGFTLQASAPNAVSLESQVQGSPGTTAGTFTSATGTQFWMTGVIAFANTH
jgi:hypothetical protein